MKSRRRNYSAAVSGSQRGFSLVELMIAGVIIAMTGALLIGGLLSANRSAEMRARQAVTAQLLASQLALIDGKINTDSPVKGNFSGAYADSTWQIEQYDTAVASVKQVQLTVNHQGYAAHAATYRILKDPQP